MPAKAAPTKQTNEAAHKQQLSVRASQEPVLVMPGMQRAVLDPGLATPADILRLQGAAGNGAVSRLIQTKLTVGGAGDPYEQEADRVAQRVLTMPAWASGHPGVRLSAGPHARIQRKYETQALIDEGLTALEKSLQLLGERKEWNTLPQRRQAVDRATGAQKATAQAQYDAACATFESEYDTLLAELKEVRQSAQSRGLPASEPKATKLLRQAVFDKALIKPEEPNRLQDIARDAGVVMPARVPLTAPADVSGREFTGITVAIETPTYAGMPYEPEGTEFKDPALRAQEQAERARLQTAGTAEGEAHLRARLAMLRPKVEQAYEYFLFQRETSGSETLGVFVGPEWYFNGPRGEPHAAAEKATLGTQMESMSQEFPNMLIMPGTIRWNKSGKVANTAITFLNGKTLHEYDKKGPAGDVRERTQFQPGAPVASQIFPVGKLNFAIDICADVSGAKAKQEYYAARAIDMQPTTGVDVHIVTAAGQNPTPTTTAVGKKGVAITSDVQGGAKLATAGPESFQETSQLLPQKLRSVAKGMTVSSQVFGVGGARPTLTSLEQEIAGRGEDYATFPPGPLDVPAGATEQMELLKKALKLLYLVARAGTGVLSGPDQARFDADVATLREVHDAKRIGKFKPDVDYLADYVAARIERYIQSTARRPAKQEYEQAKQTTASLRTKSEAAIDAELSVKNISDIRDLIAQLRGYADMHLPEGALPGKAAPRGRLANMRKLASRVVARTVDQREVHLEAQRALQRLNQVQEKQGIAGWWTKGRQ